MHASAEDFAGRRRPQPAETLKADTVQWLDKLPPEVRPRCLPTEFARIANALRAHWQKPDACRTYFDDLLIDKRGNRAGFPGTIALEIGALKDYYESKVYPTAQTTWDRFPGRRGAFG